MTGPPSQLGDYLRGELIGEGGMGAVYRARHVATGVAYALKLLPHSSDVELNLRFEREGRALATVSGHPNIVRVHSAGRAGGWLYLVQELVRGGGLEARLQAGPLPPEEARQLVIGLGQGLAHAHAHGVLHRDLKPANVLLSEDGVPCLVDFGLARVADGHSLTQTGEVLGSPNWMAPEQALGEATDERTDVYGLGAVFYHCLTGRPPIEGGSLLAILDRVVTTDPPPPRSLAPEVSPGLEAVCLQALAKRPADRFATVQHLLAGLEAPSAPARSRGWIAAAAGGAVLALVGGALVLQTSQEPQPAATPPRALPPAPPASTKPSPPNPWAAATIETPALWEAARKGDPEACRVLGEGLLAGGQHARSARWLKAAGRATWSLHRGALLAWATRRRGAKDPNPDEQLILVWALIAPVGKAYGDPEQPISRDPQDLQAAKVITEWLLTRGQDRDTAGWLRRSVQQPKPWKQEPGLTSALDYHFAGGERAHLAHYLLLKAYRVAAGPHAIEVGLDLAEHSYRHLPEVAIPIYAAVARNREAPRDLERTLPRLVELLWNADPDLRDGAALLEFAWQGARLKIRSCAQVLCTVLRSRGGVTAETLLELRQVVDAIPEPTDMTRLNLAEIYLQHSGERSTDLRLALRQIRKCAPGLRKHASVAVLRRLLEAYAKAKGYGEPEYRATYERRFPNLTERERLLILMSSSGLGDQ